VPWKELLLLRYDYLEEPRKTMRGLGAILIIVGVFWFALEVSAPGLLPELPFDVFVGSVVAVVVGIVLVYADEVMRQRRKWKIR